MRVDERYELASELRERYWAADRRRRGEMLDGFCLATGYNRKYAMSVLRGRRRKPKPTRRPRGLRYGGQQFRKAIALIWEASGYICAERLHPVLTDLAEALMEHHQLPIDPGTWELLCTVSASTLRRNLRTMTDTSGWGRPRMRRPTALRGDVPVVLQNLHRFEVAGHVQIDLVSHGGRWSTGEWIWTLCGTDLCTGWTELQPVMTKNQVDVLVAIKELHRRLPFRLLSLHIDNGFEFFNDRLIRYCQRKGVLLGRGRPHHKNDNAHVEQKNGYIVRRLLGNQRLDSPEQLEWMLELYELLRIFVNCFQPVTKRIGVVQRGDRTRRLHDTPRTPLNRLIDSGQGEPAAIDELLRLSSELSPLSIKRRVGERLDGRPPAVQSPPGRRWPEVANA
jgi:hypothetical protein